MGTGSIGTMILTIAVFLLGVLLLLAPLAIWSECRQIRKLLTEMLKAQKGTWVECSNTRKLLEQS